MAAGLGEKEKKRVEARVEVWRLCGKRLAAALS